MQRTAPAAFGEENDRRRAVAKDPAYGQPHFPIHDVKDRDKLAIAVGQRPSIDAQFAIPSKLSELRLAQAPARWWS